MVSPNIQGLGLNDELLEHYKKEVGEMALGILDGKPFNSPVQGAPGRITWLFFWLLAMIPNFTSAGRGNCASHRG